MATIKTLYGTEAQAITISLAPAGVGLADGGARESDAIDNTSDLFLDVLVQVRVKFANSAPASEKKVYVYAYGTADFALPLWPDKVTGSDAAITLNSPTQLKLIGVIEAVQNDNGTMEPAPLAQVFGGLVPSHWGIVILNKSGIALTNTESDHVKEYQGFKAQS